MTTHRAKATGAEQPDRPITRHYILVPVVETVIILALAWLASHFG